MLFSRKKVPPAGITESTFSCMRGSLTIRGTEYRPAGSDSDLPIAIVCHGFMAFQDTVRQYAIELATLGYAAYCFDFCGGSVIKGQSDGKTTEMSVLTEVTDLEAVIAYTRSLPYTNSENVLLMGCSQGGFVSALTAAKLKDEISGIILFYPALCIPDDARAGKMMFAKFDPKNPPELIRCGPMKLGKCYPNDVMNMGPFDEISAYPGKVLIVHGTKDRIVAPSYSERAKDAYLSSFPDRSVTLKIIEKGAHGFSRKHDAAAIEYIREFVRSL